MKTTLYFFSCLLYLQASAQLHLSSIFNNHMILQRDKPVKIWGTARSGESVQVTIGNIQGKSVADKNGNWKITLPPFPAGGPYTVSIKTNSGSKLFTDVLFGEIWLCSGQSNMQFKLRQALNARYEIHRAGNSRIRQLTIPNTLSFQSQNFVDSAEWQISSPQTTGDFSAVGYFFARDIFEKLQVPVGIINDNWGGSQVESWISREFMLGSDDLKEYAKQMPDNWMESDKRIEKKYKDILASRNGNGIPDMEEAAVLKTDYSFTGWLPSAAPTVWDWAGLPAYRGEGYMVKEIILDSVQASLPSTIGLGEHDPRFRWFLNGNQLPETNAKYLELSLAPRTWKVGRNLLLLEIGSHPVTDAEGVGIHGESEHLFVDFDGERITLADSKWKMLPRIDRPHHYTKWMNSEGTIIYNAMIHPLIPFSIRGVLWYQGESNTGHAAEYARTFPLMIESWRKEWKDDFPFLFVQLASFGSYEGSNPGSDWAELREAQLKTLRLHNTGMAVTTDIGDPTDVHPKNKEEVGRRLAAIALNDVYGIRQTCNGPVYQSVSFSNGKAILSFTSAGTGLWSKNRYADLFGFELAGPDHRFYFAQAIIRGDQVVVNADSVSNPVAVRYGWSNSPADINLYNKEGFPASPFRTDDWPGITDSLGFYKLPAR